MRIVILALLSICLWACGKTGSESKPIDNESVTTFITHVDNTRLREAAGPDAEVIKTLPRGTELVALGEVSDFTTQITLRGIPFDEPWLRVRTTDGSEGWVFGGALRFHMDEISELTTQLMERRLQTLFGQALSTRIQAYRQSLHAATTAEAITLAYREGTALRDTLVRIMERKIEVNNPEELPDLFWLKQMLPGFETQLVAEGTAYYLFWNYVTLSEKAATTSSSEDDAFMALQISLFPDDSIEYFYPAWFLQTWDYGGHSLLGRGVHFRTLQKIDQLLKKSDLFAPELNRLKTRLVNDMVDPHVTYWEAKEKIQAELDTILHTDFNILTPADKIALQERRQLFETPDANNIEINHQSGIYD